MKVVRKYLNEAQAQVALGLLENEGILGLVDGTNTQAALSTPILTSVRLLVDESDWEQAKEVLQNADELPDVPEWVCSQCGKDVDAGFAICWNCGAAYESHALEQEAEAAAEYTPEDFTDRAQEDLSAASNNPYDSPSVATDRLAPPKAVIEEAEERTSHAFWALIITGWILIGIPVALLLLMQSWKYRAHLSPRARRRMYVTLVILFIFSGLILQLLLQGVFPQAFDLWGSGY